MNDKELNPTDDYIMNYLLSNTSYNLFKIYRSKLSFFGMNKTYSIDYLVNAFNEITKSDIDNLSDIVKAHMILVLLSYVNYSEFNEAFQAIDRTKIRWGEKFYIYAKNMFKGCTILDITSSPQPIEYNKNNASNGFQKITIPIQMGNKIINKQDSKNTFISIQNN
jgi:hypothetical protein